jgi:hypothetical protein
MPERRRAGRRVAGILGCAAILAAIVMGVEYGFPGAKRGSGPAGSTVAALDERTPLADLGEAARSSDTRVLAVIQQRLTPASGAARTAYTEDEAKGWLQVLLGLRTGYLGFNATGRGVAVAAACRIFEGFAIEPAPPEWIEALPPLHDLLNASMGDSEPNLRAAALDEVGKLWVWLPARSITPAEESSLARWKEQVYRPVIRCLGQRDALTVVKAIACLGALPVDNAAAPALAYIDNADPEIRKQTLISFTRRNLLLTEDLLLTRLHDSEPMIRDAANSILKLRGMSQEQISLGRLIFSPKPQQRISVIPLLKDRTDVDPAIWLIQLSRDPEEMVRISAVEAMGALPSSAARRRLAEMARSDRSETVRKAAGKLAPTARENTASLPLLPGSPSLNPKAN